MAGVVPTFSPCPAAAAHVAALRAVASRSHRRDADAPVTEEPGRAKLPRLRLGGSLALPPPLFAYEPVDSFRPQFSVTPDGERFLLLAEQTEQVSNRTELKMIRNWHQVLQRITAANE